VLDQREVHPGVVATVREVGTEFTYETRTPGLTAAGERARERVNDYLGEAELRRLFQYSHTDEEGHVTATKSVVSVCYEFKRALDAELAGCSEWLWLFREREADPTSDRSGDTITQSQLCVVVWNRLIFTFLLVVFTIPNAAVREVLWKLLVHLKLGLRLDSHVASLGFTAIARREVIPSLPRDGFAVQRDLAIAVARKNPEYSRSVLLFLDS
jgi:hypothetical protein